MYEPTLCGCCCRAPWRLATYYSQTQDERVLPLLKAQLKFFEGQNMISAGYKLDGTPLESYSNIAFLAPVWCLLKVMVTTVTMFHNQKPHCNRFSQLAVPL